MKPTKSFFVRAIIDHQYSFRLSGDCKFTVCNWCGTRTDNDWDNLIDEVTARTMEAGHTHECPYALAMEEEAKDAKADLSTIPQKRHGS